MKAVLFDFNGTIFDDTRFHIAAWHDFMLRHIHRDLSESEIRRRCIGPGNDIIFDDFFGNISKEERKILGAEKEKAYRESVLADKKNTALKNGAVEVFDYLVKNGIPFAMATASPIENVEFYLNDLGMNRWFTLENYNGPQVKTTTEKIKVNEWSW